MAMRKLLALALTGALLSGGCSKGKESGGRGGKGEGDSGGGPAARGERGGTDPKAEARAAEAGAAFDKVITGMSIDQVTAIMGAPKTQIATGEITQYHWQKGPANFVVQFKDGKVLHKVYTSDRSGAQADTGKKKDFARIKVGMTRAEVMTILGRPEQESSSGDDASTGGTQHWQDGKASLTVVYQNGKVMAANVDSDDE